MWQTYLLSLLLIDLCLLLQVFFLSARVFQLMLKEGELLQQRGKCLCLGSDLLL